MQPMTHSDLDMVLAIQHKAHQPFFYESRAAFSSRLNLFPAGCWIETRGSRAAGYLVSHPWSLSNPPELHAQPTSLPKIPDCFYVHDLAVDPNFHGGGIGQDLAEKALSLSRAYNEQFSIRATALIAIGDSFSFWTDLGFRQLNALSPATKKKLVFYGNNARLMVRNIP